MSTIKAFELFGAIALDDKQYVTAMNRLERETEATGRKLERTWDRTTGRMDTTTNNAAGRVANLGAAIGRLAVPVAAAAGAIYAATGLWNGLKATAEAANNAANAQYSFGRQLQRSRQDVDQANGVVQRLATRFKVLPETIMEASTVMLRAGGDMEDVERVLTAAGGSALAAGVNVTTAFDNVSVAVATGRSELLETSGIITNLGPVTQDYAESIGKTVEELTKAEVIQARVNAIYAESEAEIEDIDQRMQGLAGVQGEANAEWVRLGRNLGEVVLPLVISLTRWFGSLVGALNKFIDRAQSTWRRWFDSTDLAIEKTKEAKDVIGSATDKNSLRKAVLDLAKDMDEKGRAEFIAFAEQAIATSDDVEEAADKIVQQGARIANALQIGRVELELGIAKQELEQAQSALASVGESGQEQALEQMNELLDTQAALRIEYRTASRERRAQIDAEMIALQNQVAQLRVAARQGRHADPTGLERNFERAKDRVEELEAQLAELNGLEIELKVTVVPDPDNPNTTKGGGHDRYQFNDFTKSVGRGETAHDRTVAAAGRDDRQRFNGFTARIVESRAAEILKQTAEAFKAATERTRYRFNGFTASLTRFDRVLNDAGEDTRHAFNDFTEGVVRDRLARNTADAADDLEQTLREASRDTRPVFNDFTDQIIAGEQTASMFDLALREASEDTRHAFNDFTGRIAGAAGERNAADAARDLEQTLRQAARDTRHRFNDFTGSVLRGETGHDRTVNQAGRDTRHRFNDFTTNIADNAVQGSTEKTFVAGADAWIKALQESENRLVSFGGKLLGVVTEQVPAIGAALDGLEVEFNEAGQIVGMSFDPMTALTSVFVQLLSQSEQFKGIMEFVGKIVQQVADTLGVLLDALWPIIDVALNLVQVGLAPVLAILEHVVAPVFRAVAEMIGFIWNGIARALNVVLRWFNISLPTIDLSANAPRPTTPEDRTEDSEDSGSGSGVGSSPQEVNFGGTPQSVQLAVATPLVEASLAMLEAATTIRDVFSGVGSSPHVMFGDSVDRFGSFVDRLVSEGVAIRVSTTGGSSAGGSGTAYLRGV